MTIERTPSGVHIIREGAVTFFAGTCDAGCRWQLFPRYRDATWVAEHSTNREAALVFDRACSPSAMLDALEDWLDCCHEYEAALAVDARAGVAG